LRILNSVSSKCHSDSGVYHLGMSMGTVSMILVPAPLDKYDARARPVPSWVPTVRIPVGIELSMCTHEFLNFFFFLYKE